jgi:hypothetical protein
MRTEETDPGLQENEKVIVDSFQKRRALMSNESSQSSGYLTQEQSQRRLSVGTSSFRGFPIRVKKKGQSVDKILTTPKEKMDWKSVDFMEPVREERDTVDSLMKGSLFSKRQNAFNLASKHKMFFALPKKTETVASRNSLKTKESTKDISKPVDSVQSVASLSHNLLPKDASQKLENLRQLYLNKLNKGPKLVSAAPMPSPAQQLMAHKTGPEPGSTFQQMSVRASLGSSFSQITRQAVNFDINCVNLPKPAHEKSTKLITFEPRSTIIGLPKEGISKRIVISDRLKSLKMKEVTEIKIAPQNTEKVIK